MTDVYRRFNVEKRSFSHSDQKYAGQAFDSVSTTLHFEYDPIGFLGGDSGYVPYIMFNLHDEHGNPYMYGPSPLTSQPVFDGYTFPIPWEITSRVKSSVLEYQLFFLRNTVSFDPSKDNISQIQSTEYIISPIDGVALKRSINRKGCNCAYPPVTPHSEPDLVGWINLWKQDGVVLPIEDSYNPETGGVSLEFHSYDGQRQVIHLDNIPALNDQGKFPLAYLPTGNATGQIPLIKKTVRNGMFMVYDESAGGFVEKDITGIQFKVVDVLPPVGELGVIYLMPAPDVGEQNVMNEFIWVDGKWEQLGSTHFELEIIQDADGISVNKERLQTATESRAGLMTKEQVADLNSKLPIVGGVAQYTDPRSKQVRNIIFSEEPLMDSIGSDGDIYVTPSMPDTLNIPWGSMVGNISDQIDLSAVLNYKADKDLLEKYLPRAITDSIVTDISNVEGTDSFKLRLETLNPQTNVARSVEYSFPIANEGRAGMMSKADVTQLRKNTADIASLSGLNLIYRISTFIDNPTQAQLNEAYNRRSPSPPFPPRDGTTLIDISNGKQYTWFATDNPPAWVDRGNTTIKPATQTTMGIVKGSEDAGKVFVENDGTMSLIGYDKVIDRLGSLDTQLKDYVPIKGGPMTGTLQVINPRGQDITLGTDGRVTAASIRITDVSNIPRKPEAYAALVDGVVYKRTIRDMEEDIGLAGMTDRLDKAYTLIDTKLNARHGIAQYDSNVRTRQIHNFIFQDTEPRPGEFEEGDIWISYEE